MRTKTCTKCGASKPFEDFHLTTRSKDGRRSRCKACRKGEDPNATARASRYYSNNRERVLEYVKSYSQGNPDVRAKAQRRWLEKNGYVYQKKWKTSNPGKVNALTAKRRNCVRKATPKWANFRSIESFYIAARRLSEETGIAHHVDHVVPLTSKLVCGLHNEFNLQILTGPENLAKHNRHWPDMP